MTLAQRLKKSARERRYYQRHREAVLAKKRAYYTANRAALISASAAYKQSTRILSVHQELAQ